MEVSRAPKVFRKVVIELDSQDDFDVVYHALNFSLNNEKYHQYLNKKASGHFPIDIKMEDVVSAGRELFDKLYEISVRR